MLESDHDALSELSDNEPLGLKIGESENWDRKLSPGRFLSMLDVSGERASSEDFSLV